MCSIISLNMLLYQPTAAASSPSVQCKTLSPIGLPATLFYAIPSCVTSINLFSLYIYKKIPQNSLSVSLSFASKFSHSVIKSPKGSLYDPDPLPTEWQQISQGLILPKIALQAKSNHLINTCVISESPNIPYFASDPPFQCYIYTLSVLKSIAQCKSPLCIAHKVMPISINCQQRCQYLTLQRRIVSLSWR